MILTAFGIGIAIGYVFFEITGLTAGGILVPGYLALYLDEPLRIATTLSIALITHWIMILAGNLFILYGRRRYLLTMLIGFLFNFIANTLMPTFINDAGTLQIIGYIIPGLIAADFYRQGVLQTILAMGVVCGTVFIILQMLFF